MAKLTSVEGNTRAIAESEAARLAEEKRLEDEKMRDVLVLLDNMLRREDVTLKLIIDCLYDIGSVDFINQRIQQRPVNRLLKSATRMSKPVLRHVAAKWVQKNCPKLIANWLYGQVKKAAVPKPPRKKTPLKRSSPVTPPPLPVMDIEVTARQLEASHQEIRRLRSQVRLLAGALIGAITAFGTAAVWISQDLSLELNDLTQPIRSTVVEAIDQVAPQR